MEIVRCFCDMKRRKRWQRVVKVPRGVVKVPRGAPRGEGEAPPGRRPAGQAGGEAADNIEESDISQKREIRKITG